jgi:hypothetical protein
MSLLDEWMPSYDVAARYRIRIAADPREVYSTLLTTDLSRPWLVRGLMGVRLLPGLFRSPRRTWHRLAGGANHRASLSDLGGSEFTLLEQRPPDEIVLGITGKFWTLAATIVAVPVERFRDPLAPGLAQGAWNFEIRGAGGGSELTTETRVRCADDETRRHFTRYWRIVAPGSALIRHAILGQVRREAEAGAR